MTAPTDEWIDQRVQAVGPFATFPWHLQQSFALASATDTIVVLGGTQGGKSSVGMGMLSRLIRREGPIYDRLLGADARPLKLWVAPKTGEKAESVWEPLLRTEAFRGLQYTYKATPWRVFTWADAVSDENTLWIKSQDQGLLAFESDKVDCVLFDEEPLDRKLVAAAQGRTTTTGGVLILAFTPLHGLTWTHGAYYVPCVRPEYRVADRVWRMGNRLTVIQMGMADNPAAVQGGGVQRLRDDPTISDAERRTRLYGEYGYAEGLIFPVLAGLFTDQPDSHFLLDGLPRDRAYSWVLAMDPNKRHGAVLCAIDHAQNYYVVAEHYAEGVPDSVHAARYRELLARLHLSEGDVMCYADPGGAGAQAIINLAALGLYADAVPKDAGSVKASIEMVRRALWLDPQRRHPVTDQPGAPALYFLRTLRSQWEQEGVTYDESRVLWELRQYRHKDSQAPDTPIKVADDCVDCLRYVFLVRPFGPDAAAQTWPRTPPKGRPPVDRMSQRATSEFDRLAAQVAKSQARGGR